MYTFLSVCGLIWRHTHTEVAHLNLVWNDFCGNWTVLRNVAKQCSASRRPKGLEECLLWLLFHKIKISGDHSDSYMLIQPPVERILGAKSWFKRPPITFHVMECRFCNNHASSWRWYLFSEGSFKSFLWKNTMLYGIMTLLITSSFVSKQEKGQARLSILP